MAVKLKPLGEQVVVITGASSGIGLTTARMAAERGVKGLVLAARSDDALTQLEQQINAAGKTQAVAVPCDVADESAVRRVAEVAKEKFGGFDTWVNNAGVSVYGRLTEVSEEDHRRLFETNFWGVVHGSRVAVESLGQRGGSLINIGSTLSDRAIPLQGMYVASKHAVKGFTDALRMEVEEARLPISVTLIKPAAIDTPYTSHAKNYMADAPKNPAPVYAPELVAETILYAAEHPVRDLFVGSAGKAFSLGEKLAPRAVDRFMEKALFRQQHSGKPRHDRDALHAAGNDLRQRGDYDGPVRETSLYTAAMTHPRTSAATLIGVGVAAALGVLLLSRPKPRTTAERAWDYAKDSARGIGGYARRYAKQVPGYLKDAQEYLEDVPDQVRRGSKRAAKTVSGWW